MLGRFFALELGCPASISFHDNDDMEEETELGCAECQGLGCDKCKYKRTRKKKPVKVITLTEMTGALPVMNLPLNPWSSQMAMFQKADVFTQ